MEDNEQQQGSETSNGLTGFVCMCTFALAIAAFIAGRAYQQKRDSVAIHIFDASRETINTMRGMEVPEDPFMLLWLKKSGGYMARFEVANDEQGVGYLEVHYIPRAALNAKGDK